jgi:large subunit ribosomal protein L10
MAEVLLKSLDYKKKIVAELAEKMKHSKTILVASTRGLPSSQFHKIKKALRDKAEIRVAKKTIMLRAIAATENGALQNLKEHITSDVAIFISKEDAFELSALLVENESPTKAKAGEIALEDINIEPGPTDLVPGPAISELSGVGLKVAVEGGKLAIKQGATVAKKGELIKPNVASVLGKLNITPMKAGFVPIAVYDGNAGKVYVGIKIDKKEALETLRISIAKALGFAVNINYVTDKTISYFIRKATLQGKAIENKVHNQSNKEEAQ